jgi:hypothetical protein
MTRTYSSIEKIRAELAWVNRNARSEHVRLQSPSLLRADFACRLTLTPVATDGPKRGVSSDVLYSQRNDRTTQP